MLYGMTYLQPKSVYAQREPVNFVLCSFRVEELYQELAPLDYLFLGIL